MPDDPTPGAADYLAFARHGDGAALERALHACADAAYTQARRSLGNAADADDAVQEALLQLVRSAPRFDGSVPFAAWVGRLVQVACLRLRRSDRRRRRREEMAMADQPPVPTTDALADAVRAQVARLPEADRQVIELHYFGGLARPEVAAALGIGENAVSQRLTRARLRLRALLGRPAVSAAAIGGLLAAQPAYAASAPVQAGIGGLVAAAAGGALPATTIPLTLTQKGLLLMSLHPVAAALCAGLLAVAGALPVLLWGADAAVPAPPPAPAATATAAATAPWQGAARQVLPFLAPDAPVRMAADWTYLRGQALDIKPLSLLADPRAQATVAHVREQFRLWALAGDAMPDWPQLLARADGAAFALRWPAPALAGGTRMLRDDRMETPEAAAPWPQPEQCFIAALGGSDAAAVLRMMSATLESRGRPAGPATVGPFAGIDLQRSGLAVQAGSCWGLAHRGLLQEGVDRRDAPPPPAPVWVRVDTVDAIAALAAMDRDGEDPLGLATLLGPDWRKQPPVLTASLERDGAQWRSAIAIDGVRGLPLRAPSPAIAGCVPAGALASLVIGTEPQRLAALLARWIDDEQAEALSKPLTRAGIPPGSLAGWLDGAAALVVQPGAPLPAATLVLGLRDGAVAGLQPVLAEALPRFGLAAAPAATGALAAWSLATPIGMVHVQLAADRVVASTGDAAAFLAASPGAVDGALAIDADLPALARSYLPLLAAMLPAKPAVLGGLPFQEFATALGRLGILRNLPPAAPPVDLDSLRSDGSRMGIEIRDGVRREYDADQQAIDALRSQWRRLAGREGVPINPQLAIFRRPGDRRSAALVLVMRRADGWRLADIPGGGVGELIPDRAALDRRLAGHVLVAGTAPDALAIAGIPDPPTIDRRWLPPVAAIADHLPLYRLRLHPTATGLRAEEGGLPLAAFFAVVVATAATCESYQIRQLHGAAVLRREGPAARIRHQRALAALARAYRTLEKRPAAEEPLWTPSRMLAAAGVPLAELASLTGGSEPTPEEVDRLGRWRPAEWLHQHFEWRIPIEKGLFIECAFWRNGVGLTAVPQWIIQPLREWERERMVEGWRQRRSAKPAVPAPAAPPPPPATSDF